MIHILVIDDDEKLNRTICKWLNDVGFEAKGVLNAKDASILGAHKFLQSLSLHSCLHTG